MSISNIRTITPSLTDIKDYTPVLKIGDKYLVNGIGGDFIPVKGTVIEDATATASDILEGKIAYNNEGKVTGTYKPLDITDATAQAGDIVEGKTAYIKSGKVTGTYVPSSGGGAFYKCSAVYQAGASTPSTSSSQNFKLTIPPVNDYAASYDFYIQDDTATGKNRVWKIDKSKYSLPYRKVTSIYFRQIDNFWVLQTEDGIRFTSQSAADNPWDKTNWMDINTSAQCQFSFQMHSSGSVQGYTLGFHAVCQMEGMTPETVDYIFTMQDTAKTGWERTWVSSDGTLRLQAKVYIQQTPGSDVDDSARTWFITSASNSATNVWEADQNGSNGPANPWGMSTMMYGENSMEYALTWTPQSGGGSSQSSNSSQPQGASWSGYKAILSSGKYSFSTVETTGLTYTSIKPVVGGIYTQDALVIIKDVYSGFPVDGLIFYAPLKAEKANAETSQQLTYNGTYAFSDNGGLSCIDLSNGYVTIQGTSGLSLNSFSIVMWVNMKSTSGWQNLFGTGVNNNLNIAVKDGIPVFWGGSYTIGGTDILQPNKWYCICGSYTDSTISTYINGVQNFTGSYTKSMSISSNLKIGKSSDNCNARIAAVRLYNRVLSASQVAALTSEYTPTT